MVTTLEEVITWARSKACNYHRGTDPNFTCRNSRPCLEALEMATYLEGLIGPERNDAEG